MTFVSRLVANHRKLLLGGVLLLLVVFGGAAGKASAQDCDNNSIIKCGFTSNGDFINKVRKNDSLNGHHDLQPIYAHYGLEPADYDRFVTTARPGTAYKDGRIVVDGQVVATNAQSIGRLASYQGSGYFATNIAGAGTFYGNTNAKAFKGNSIPVTVMFNAQGSVEFAVLSSCGNPIYGTNVAPSYSCDLIHSQQVTGKPDTFTFTTSASAANNASIVKVVYNFGDGATATVTNPATPVSHTYAKGGSYPVTTTVYVSLPGNQTITITSANCATTITIAIPYATCIQLTGAILDASKYSYSFTVSASFGNGAKFTSADFDFGDKNVTKGVVPNGTSATTTHAYATAGNYTATATLHFAGDGLTDATCIASLTPTQPPTPECKPGVPQGSPLCAPCQYNSSIPASDTVHCIAPANLPNTGAGDVIAVFAAAAVGGFLIFRQFIYKRQPGASEAVMTLDGSFIGPVVSPESGVVVGHHAKRKHHLRRQHPNAVHPLHHPGYHQPRRFRPRSSHPHDHEQ